MTRILHITDFHLNSKNLRDWNDTIKKIFIEKIIELNGASKINFVAFTGDLIDCGGSDFGDANTAFEKFRDEVIVPIIDAIDIPLENFLIVPGNHDVVRKNDSERDELGSQQYFVDPENVRSFMINAVDNNDFSGMKRMKPYKDFEKKLYQDIQIESKQTIFGSSFIYKDQNEIQSIGISCLNSSWRCYGNQDKGRLLIGEKQLTDHLNFIENTNFKIALLHHPLDSLSEIENSIVSQHMYKDFDLILIGDIHENSTTLVSGITGNAFVNISPSGLLNMRTDSSRYYNGFTLIDVDHIEPKICVTYFKYVHKLKKYLLNTEASGNDEGKFCQQIPEPQEKEDNRLINKILDSIKENHFTTIDNHMIGVRAEIEISSIKEAFVMPPINIGDSLNENESSLNLNQIIQSNHSQIFFGNKESGKTVLLYRLVREYVDEYQHIRKVPVYINLDELGNKEIQTAIREYLSCSSKEVKRLLDTKEITLLIDNLNYSESAKNIDKFRKVNRFSNEYDGIQIIATGEGNITNSLPPMEYVKYCEIPFKTYFIQNLGSKEIKSLLRMWSPQIDQLQLGEKLNKLVSDFKSYSLPSTAMSVSLFLWSTSNNEKKPINSAVLLEIYIETILEKLSEENIYRSTFDFKNKLQLLSKIAQEMLIANEDDYSLKYSEFIKVIETYLTDLVGFDYQSSVIADYFIKRKIFIQFKGDRVKFMYSCFFHYFLAKRMEFNQEFKQFILSEKEYFKFVEEINYYTGLTRSDKSLLELVLERFKLEFSKTDFVFDQLKDKWDKFFIIRDKDDHLDNEEDKFESVAKRTEIIKIKENRPSEKMMDEFQDKRLSSIKEPGKILKKNGDVNLETLLVILANVLRNSEGVEDINLKKDAYDMIVKYSMVWTVLYREYLLDYIIENKKLPRVFPMNVPVTRIFMDLPLFSQYGMFKHLGTGKLAPIILSKIKNDSLKLNYTESDLEAFFSVAMYADIKGKDFPTHLKNLIKRVKNNPVRDYLYYKLIHYYYSRTSIGSENEEIYIDLLTELKMRTQNLPSRMKDKVKKEIIKSKQKFLKK